MEYQRDELEYDVETEPIIDLGAKTKASVALGGLLATGALDGVAHLGLAGAVIGTVLTGILVVESPRIVKKLQQDFPEFYAWIEQHKRNGQDLDQEEEAGDEYDEEGIAEFMAEWNAVQERVAQKAHNEVVLRLSTSWSPLADSFLSQRIIIIGQPGSGKSNSVADIVEEIGPLGVPLLLLDTEDEYNGLCHPRYLPHGKSLGTEQINAENAREFGQSIVSEKLQVVLNLQSYEADDEAAFVMCELIAGINEWEEAQPAGERVSCMVILDEAAVWLPQAVNESILSKPILTQLQQTFFSTVVRRGRKRGIGFLLATQRIAEIDKRALSATWVILHRQTLPNDLKVYEKYGIEPEAARSLRPGQAYVLGPGDFHEIVQFRKRHSQDKAFTPGLASVRSHTPQRSVPSRSAYSEQQKARTRARELRLRGLASQSLTVSQHMPQANEAEEPKARQVVPSDLARAFALWQAGADSVRKLEATAKETGYGWSNGYCRDLISAMKDHGLIQKRE